MKQFVLWNYLTIRWTNNKLCLYIHAHRKMSKPTLRLHYWTNPRLYIVVFT